MKRKMRKATAFLLTAIMAMAAVGCTNGDVKTSENGEVTLGEYLGVTYTPTQPEEVTDEAVQAQIEEDLAPFQTAAVVEDRGVKKGDTVNIDYEGSIDGELFDGGTAAGYNLVIGSNSFIPGFEDGLVGAKTGETRTVTATFPNPYQRNTDLSGKEAQFKVTVNSITEPVDVELTDEFVKENFGIKTVSAYKKSLRATLEANAKEAAKAQDEANIIKQVCDNATIVSYPEGAIEEFMAYYENIANMYGYEDLASFAEAMGETEESVREEVIKTIGQMMIFEAIAEKEGLKISEEEKAERMKGYLAQNGFDSEEAFEKEAGCDYETYFNENTPYAGYTLEKEILATMARDLVLESAVEKK